MIRQASSYTGSSQVHSRPVHRNSHCPHTSSPCLHHRWTPKFFTFKLRCSALGPVFTDQSKYFVPSCWRPGYATALYAMQVAAACQRVAGLRATVPNQLSQRLTEHLQQCCPASDCVCDVPSRDDQPAALDQTAAEHGTSPTAELASSSRVTADAGHAPLTEPHADALRMTPLSPAPAKLQNMYMTAVQRMPALRCVLPLGLLSCLFCLVHWQWHLSMT